MQTASETKGLSVFQGYCGCLVPAINCRVPNRLFKAICSVVTWCDISLDTNNFVEFLRHFYLFFWLFVFIFLTDIKPAIEYSEWTHERMD